MKASISISNKEQTIVRPGPRYQEYWFKFFLIVLFSLSSRTSDAQVSNEAEFRGVWIATINNIDWPSSPGLPVEKQKKELEDLINRIRDYNLNTIFFQVRPAADAFYASETEPWSWFLTGKQGKPTTPFFDPLAYAIELCHTRGMRLYAWFNPFRVRNIGYYELSINSFAARNPQFQHDYDNKRFFDPGYPQVRTHVVKVIIEVVRKYNIDGILLDDYFYPYPVAGKRFPDSKAFTKYGKGFSVKQIKDWRRNNIDLFISELNDGIKAVKPELPLGISPFGVWRSKTDDPEGSPLLRGTTSFDDLYADVQKWLSKDWIDFVIPQLYWEKGNRFGDFDVLAKWWNDHCHGKPLYLGQALYKTTGKSWKDPNEISSQISRMRKHENIKGFALFSASHLARIPKGENSELLALLSIPEVPTLPGDLISENIKTSVTDTIIMTTDVNSFDQKLNFNDHKALSNTISVPGKLGLRKNRKNWFVSWSPSDTLHHPAKKMILLTYQPAKDTIRYKRRYNLEGKKDIIIAKEKGFNPRKGLFMFGAINETTGEGSFSPLFRIKRNRIIYR